MEGGRQLRLLLWRDYLIRKRNFITLAGVLWASGIMFGIYTVRINIDNKDFPSCQYAARALPSAGIMTFLQSFVCNVNNECNPMEQFEELPAYENSTLTQIQRKVSPLVNESVIELATSMPDAVKLLATLADVADEPTFLQFAKNGMRVKDLFMNPSRTRRYVTSQLQLDDDVTQSLMTAEISFQGILNGDIDRCKADSLNKTFQIQNAEHLNIIVKKLCSMTKEEMQKMTMDLVYQMDLTKYIKMLGNMYYKMSGDERLTQLGDFVRAVLRMTKLNHFLPPELVGIFQGKAQDFTYIDINLIQKFVKLFEPTFGNTEQYKSISELADILVIGTQYLNKIFGNLSPNDTVEEITEISTKYVGDKIITLDGFDKINKVLDNAAEAVDQIGDGEATIDPIDVLSKLTVMIHKFLPNNYKHDVLFYSTILSKLIESAHKVVYINMNLEDIIHNVTLRNPQGVKLMLKLPLMFVSKALEGLVSPERTQIITSNLNAPGAVFCDVGKLQRFFEVSKEEGEQVKNILCTDDWKNYVHDLLNAFGIHDVKNSINEMASLFIQETLGKDTSSQLYSIEQDFQIFKNFTQDLVIMESNKKPGPDWKKVLGVEENSPFMKTLMNMHFGKLILISIHGALAKEVISQNTILQYKITPIFLDASVIVDALIKQLELVPQNVTVDVKQMYGDIVETVLLTAMDEHKTYKSLSTFSQSVVCEGGENAKQFMVIPNNIDTDRLASALCNAFIAIENGMKNDSIISKAVSKVQSTTHTMLEEIKWTELISSIQKLYIKVNQDYPYVFEYSTYAMDNVTQGEVKQLMVKAKEFWFSLKNIQKGLHLSVNLGFRLLDLLDHGIFNMTGPTWLKIKHVTNSAVGPLNVIDDVIKTVAGLITNTSVPSTLPSKTSEALGKIIPNLPNLIVDSINILVNDDTDIEPIISLLNAEVPWPCSASSISELIAMSPNSAEAVRGLETLLCLNNDMQREWTVYIDEKRARIYRNQTWKNTKYPPHIFLQMSSTFDSLVNDTVLVKSALRYILNDDVTDDHIGLISAWKYAAQALNVTNRHDIIIKFLSKFDTVLNSVQTADITTDISVNSLWEQYIKCFQQPENQCRDLGRTAWKYSLKALATIFENVAEDLTVYFTEINEPDSTPLQVLGFTKSTPLYMLYEKLPQFISVLLNSYWDFGFMSQIRRATMTAFWDCDAVVSALTPPPNSPIQKTDIDKVKPYLCPSFIYWLSMPRGANILFNIVAKPQYFIYNVPADNTTSTFENSYNKAVALADLLKTVADKNKESVTKELETNTLQAKLNKFVDKILNFKINEADPHYVAFNQIYRDKFMTDIYLTRIVAMTNKISDVFMNLTLPNDATESLTAELSSIRNIFRRRAVDVISLHFDVITDALWTNDENYSLINALETICNSVKDNEKAILSRESRVKQQICAKNYKLLYKEVENAIVEDYDEARNSLFNLISVLQDGEVTNDTDVFEIFNNRPQIIESLSHSIKFSYDLGLPYFVKYLQTNIQSYRVLISFLSGGDWWKQLKEIFLGSYAENFFEYVEQSLDITDFVLNNLDGIHLVRLARDMNLNESDSFCNPSIQLSDYIPDNTGTLSGLKQQLCTTNYTDLFRELPPLLFASQGYENSLKLPKEVDYQSLKQDTSLTESQLTLIKDGPKEPHRPSWVTEQKIDFIRQDMMKMLTKESLTKIAFGIMSNGVDAGTLFLNSSSCAMCSQLTSWVKQLNLQVIKKAEYDSLLCHAHALSQRELYHALRNDFHWDMFVREIISSRNYTKYELNKSMNEFLDLVKGHLLEDMASPTNKLTECLVKNVTRNEFGNVTLFIQVLAHTAKLLQAEVPYLQDIEGIKDVPYLNELADEIAHNLDIYRPVKEYLKMGDIKNEGMDVENADVNLRVALMENPQFEDLIKPKDGSVINTCESDCADIVYSIINKLDLNKIEEDLPKLQLAEYWKFPFITTILQHIDSILSHTARLTGVASSLDVKSAMEGKFDALLDVLIVVLMDDNVDAIGYSLQGLIEGLHPLIKNTALEDDMDALATGLRIVQQFKTYLVEEMDLKLQMSEYFHSEGVEIGLTALGINNTNFWSLAAPRIAAGYIDLKPVISPRTRPYHISSFVCNMETMGTAVLPAHLDVVTLDDVLAATADQFCGMKQEQVIEVIRVLLANVKFSGIIDKIKEVLLTKLYTASDLTSSEGSNVLNRFPRMAQLLPSLQEKLGEVMDLVVDEPLFKTLKDFSSVGSLLGASGFMQDAGRMMCGKPFNTDMSRMIKNVINSKEQVQQVDQRQLNSLPTDFCRSMYEEITSIDGGKIVWSFIKPLLMGRILYTPDTPAVRNIMGRVNETFANMIRLTNLVHSFADAFPSLDNISTHRSGLEAFQQLMNQQGMEAFKQNILGDVQLNVDVNGMFQKLGDFKDMGGLISKASSLLQCIRMDRISPVQNETELMHKAAQLHMTYDFSAGIVFLNPEKLANSLENVEYKIRMDIENAPTTHRKKSFMWIPGPEASFVENMRYFRGYIQLQDLIDKAIIKLSMENIKNTTQLARRTKRDEQAQRSSLELADSGTSDVDWAVYTQQMPYPCYRKDYFQTSLYESQALIVGFFFSMLFTVVSVVRFIVADKESGNTMLMSVMGVNLSYHTLSWFIASFVEVTLTALCVTAVLKWGHILPNTSFSIVFLLIFFFGIAMLSFSYMLSKLFVSASLAAVCAGILLLLTFMPFVIILSLETALAGVHIFLVCLFMSSSLCYSFLHITRFEAMGVGLSWTNILDSPTGDSTNVVFAAGMMLLDAAIYFAIGYCIDRYYGIKSLSNSITRCSSTSEKTGVSIVNVTKVYGEGSRRAKVALDNVSMELQRGHITTLLGHNGAGKTTLIKILTGMLKPTKGHIIIRDEDQATSTTKRGRAGVGVCPQHDVLVECLTTREHITLYAQLDAEEGEDVEKLVDKMLQQMSLSRYSEVRVSRLSGGTRRRLCVALAFVARAHLTVLDEPTAGVDPSNRRDIWSMIMKLREGRTILLTTHHLDEAEILSDQIIIMHKGQIHTTGSPVEIKRSLGSGYKLTVMLTDKRTDERTDEQAKLVLGTVRQVVRNATVSDVTDTQVDIMMPFYDTDGASNNFLHLCKTLEEAQPRLGFTNFTLDCSTLEQVFFDICTKADTQNTVEYGVATEGGSGSAVSTSTSSVRSSQRALVSAGGARRGARRHQLTALLTARALSLLRNRSLFFMVLVMPIVFVAVAMAFSTLRPPADNEHALSQTQELYNGTTQFLVPHPSISMESDSIDPSFAELVMKQLLIDKDYRDWTQKDSPVCRCEPTHQQCEFENVTRPEMMILPNVDTLNSWLIGSQQLYIEKRYGGFTSTIKNNMTRYIAWYNNKGYHAMPVYVNTLNNAILRTVTGTNGNITTYSHPMKISKEQLSKDTFYQHVADAGISALVLVAMALCGAAGAQPLVAARARKDHRLHRLAAVAPSVYWGAALIADLTIIFINMVLTAAIMYAFGFDVFVARNNLPAICVLIMLYGFACCSMVHVVQKVFSDASVASMMLFCGNAFAGLVGMAVLLILDLISESDATDNARWVLHKIFLLSPQFTLGDGMLEIAKNTVQSVVLERFGMDTYRDPFASDLILLHVSYLVCVGVFFLVLNLAIESGHMYWLVDWFKPKIDLSQRKVLEPEDVAMERKRVAAARSIPYDTVSLPTLGNINKGFVDTEGKKNSLQRTIASSRDVLSCEGLTQVYGGPCAGATNVALADLTVGVQPGQCLALLGENGAGKSTTFALWTGEFRPTAGQIYLHGIKRNQRGLERGLISYCPQSDAIDPLLTVEETLQLYCRLRGITEEEEVIERTLELFELVRYRCVRSGELSGGNRRKLCTALALAGRAPLLLLDEPTSGMDPVSRRCVWAGVAGARGAGRGVVLSTHALDDARAAATTVALLRAGTLHAHAPLQDCLNRFGGGYVVSCRCWRVRAAWTRVRNAAPYARLRVMHTNTLHFLIPHRVTVDGKEMTTKLSDIFLLMAELQSTTDIEDFTVNQSSLEQMFLSFSDKSELDLEEDFEPSSRRNSEQIDSITSL